MLCVNFSWSSRARWWVLWLRWPPLAAWAFSLAIWKFRFEVNNNHVWQLRER